MIHHVVRESCQNLVVKISFFIINLSSVSRKNFQKQLILKVVTFTSMLFSVVKKFQYM